MGPRVNRRETRVRGRDESRNARIAVVGPLSRPAGALEFGGNATDCDVLLKTLDELGVPAVGVDTSVRRGARPIKPVLRLLRCLLAATRARPDATLVFASAGLGLWEKSLWCRLFRGMGSTAVLSVRSGRFYEAEPGAITRRLRQLQLKSADLILCQCRSQREYLVSRGLAQSNRCKVLENWTATARLLELPMGRPRDPGPLRLLYMGAIEKGKGLDDLLEALRLTHPLLPGGCRLLVAGSGRMVPALLSAGESDLRGRVRLVGVVTGESRTRLFEWADVAVLPSHSEGLSNFLVEALAAGIPVITTDVGCSRDVLREAGAGELVPAHRPDLLAAALVTMAGDSDRLREFGVNARRLAEKRFGARKQIASLLAMLGVEPPARLAADRVSRESPLEERRPSGWRG